MKFNPDYHSNVVRNYRRLFANVHGIECTLTDEQIWIIQDRICAPTGEQQDEWVCDELKNVQDGTPTIVEVTKD